MEVREGMSKVVLTLGPGHTLREAAQRMTEKGVGGEHMSDTLITAAPEWSLERAAMEMARRHIRHLVVVEGSELIGVLSMRDIVRVWTSEGATSGMTSPEAEADAAASP